MIKPFSNLLLLLSPENRKLTKSLVNVLGFYPKNITLYKQAFRHRSSAISLHNNAKSSNERLEYLGDAILGAVVAELLFKKFPYKDEGFLTEMRSKIVSRDNLSKLAMKMGVSKLIEYDPRSVNKSINGDAFEALIGAVYLDVGYTKTRNFILKRVIKIHVDVDELETTELNFKSRLIEWGQRERKSVRFEVLEELGHGNRKQIKVQVMLDDEGHGTGIDFSKKKAEQIAAQKTLEALGIN